MKVKECMCDNVIWVREEASIRDVAKIMLNKDIGCVLICDAKKKMIGLVTDRDLVSRGIARK